MTGKLETFVRSRQARVAVAGFLAATGLWAFAPYALNDVGSEAYVNAPLTRIVSPIAGITNDRLPAIGSYIATPTALRLVTARTLDDAALGALNGQQAALGAALTLATGQLRELAAADVRLAARAARYGRAETGRLAEQALAARADTRACLAEAGDAEAQAQRVLALAARGFAANAAVDRATANMAGARARCAALKARAAARADEAAAARHGLYLGNGTADTPYAEQQRDRLLLRRQDLETVAADARARLAELAPQIAAERRRLARTAAYDITLPAATIIWQAATSPGASVAPGSPLLDLADCTRRFVEVTLPERRMETLGPGQTLKVRLVGADDWQTGTVTRIAGAAARREAAMVAAGKADRDPRTLTVEVALPPAEITSAARRCDIGRLAEVRFPRWPG